MDGPDAPSPHPLQRVLLSDAPVRSGPSAAFGRLTGSWALTWTGLDARGRPAEVPGDLTFGWVLGGSAVQDVWQVPGDGVVPPPGFRAFHGTTVRFHDAALGAWRSTWVDPVNGRVRTFVGRPEGEDLVLVSLDGEPLLRWRFTQVEPDSFTWLGELSRDEGRTWELEETMVARRRRDR